MTGDELVLVGMIAGAHGIRGEIRIKSLSDRMNRFKKGTGLTVRLFSSQRQILSEQQLTIEASRSMNRDDLFLLKIKEIQNRNDAEALQGGELYALPLTDSVDDNLFFYYQLIDLLVKRDGQDFGVVRAIRNFGASDILEIQGKDGQKYLIPFLEQYFPDVSPDAGYIELTAPDELLDQN